MIPFADYRYIDFAPGVEHRNNVIELDDLPAQVDKAKRFDCYRTWFRFPPKYKKHCEEHKTVSGYRELCYADGLWFDVDDPDLEKAKKTVVKLVGSWEVDFEIESSSIYFWFSGKKGFHIVIPSVVFGGFTPSPRLPQIFKKMAQDLGGDLVDLAIYDMNRLFRIANTIHKETKLWKVPLKFSEIVDLSVDQIKELAKNSREIDRLPPSEMEENVSLKEIYKKYFKDLPSRETPVTTEVTIPKDRKRCIYELLKGVGEGVRDEAAIRLAGYFREEGLAKDMVESVLMSWNGRNSPPLSVEAIHTKVESAFQGGYTYSCQDPLLSKHCSEKCFMYKSKEGRVKPEVIKTISEMADDYLEYLKVLKTSRVKLGYPWIDQKIRGIGPGELLFLIARPGVGKTALLQNILRNISKYQQIRGLFLSLEQPNWLCFERFASIIADMPGEEVESIFKADGFPAMLDMEHDLSFILTSDLPAVRIDEIPAFIQCAKEKSQGHLGVLVIDYLNYLDGQNLGRTPYEVVSALAKALKVVAREDNIPVICAAQVSRAGGDGKQALNLSSARDSGTLEEAGDIILGAYRPNLGENNDDVITVQILKNKKGRIGDKKLRFDSETLFITEETENYEEPKGERKRVQADPGELPF